MLQTSQVALILGGASLLGVISVLLHQPLIVGYLLAGLIFGNLKILGDLQIFSGLGHLGVALLLFLLGVEMNLEDMKRVGKTIIYTAIGQIFFTSFFGFLLLRIFHFDVLASIYLSIAFSFSSTVIIVKLLSDKKDLNSLYGRISVGFLFLQDLVAILLLMFLVNLGKEGSFLEDLFFTFVKIILLLLFVLFIAKKILYFVFSRIAARSTELLFVLSIAWALGFASFVEEFVGGSLEIGGFLAGLSLSFLPVRFQISSRVRPLRDFFLTIFFFLLGASLKFKGGLMDIFFPGIFFSLFVLIGNPLIVMVILGILGYKKRTSFLAGLTVAQISEFSLILASLGFGLGHITHRELSLLVMVGILTMTISSYLIYHSDKIYELIKDYLGIFERKNPQEINFLHNKGVKEHILVVGADRTGREIIDYLLKKGEDFLVVDFNPKVFENLSALKIPVIFGDISDSEIMEASALDKARLIISTVPHLQDNLAILEKTKKSPKRILTIFVAQNVEEALTLYEKGATYVIVPDEVSGEHTKYLLKRVGNLEKELVLYGKKEFERLLSRRL